MKSKKQNNDKDNSLSKKWIYLIIAALVVGFGAYGYFKVKQWVRYTIIENTEKPITGYTITNVSVDEHLPYRHRGYNDDNEKEKTHDYSMEVFYQGKNYKLEIDETTYSVFKDNGNVKLYYDSEADEVFVAGDGSGNILGIILIGILVIITVADLLIRRLIKTLRKKSKAKHK